jgi:hypothetical protein
MPELEWCPSRTSRHAPSFVQSARVDEVEFWRFKHTRNVRSFVQNAHAELEAAKALDDTLENRTTKLVCEMALEIGEIELKIAELFNQKSAYGFAKDSFGNLVHEESHVRFDAQIQAHRKELDDIHAAHIATVPEGETKVSWWTKLFELSKRIPCADDVRPRSDWE